MTVPEARTAKLYRALAVTALLVLLVHGGWQLWQPAELTRTFSQVPDGVEYTLAAQNLLTLGRGELYLNGAFHPSRYLPWMSLVFVLPFLAVFGSVMYGFAGCWAAATATLGAAVLAVRKMRNFETGLLAGAALLYFDDFVKFGSLTMTEAPYTMLMFAALIAYIKLRGTDRPRFKTALCFGLCCAGAGMLRSTGYITSGLLILALYHHRRELSRRTALTLTAAAWLPSALFVAASAAFNRAVFGSWLRGGYHYWSANPSDYPELIFQWKYFTANWMTLWSRSGAVWLPLTGIALAALYFWAVRQERDKAAAFAAGLEFTGLALGVAALLYLPYFSYQERFWLPGRALLLTVAVAAAGGLTEIALRRYPVRHWYPALAAALVLLNPNTACEEQQIHDQLRSLKIGLLQYCAETLPDDAALLSIFVQGPGEFFFAQGKPARRFIPLYRCYEYAVLLETPHRIDLPHPPRSYTWDELDRELLRLGATSPYGLVAAENPAATAELVDSGKPVFVTSYSLMIWKPALELLAKFNLTPVGEYNGFTVFRLGR